MENLNPEVFLQPNPGSLEYFERFRITDSTAISTPSPVITIGGETISTEGNLTTISGSSKSGKSAFTSILIAGAISVDGIIDGLDGVEVKPNQQHKAVIHIDTEQARHKHLSNIKTIIRRCGADTFPEYFLSYNIREMEISEYASTTEQICKAASDQFKGIHLIVIDGIADYIPDVNDPEESNAIVKIFEGIAVRYSTPILVIVHTNPGSDKERGHLGSQLQRKSESVLIVKKEGDLSYIEPKLLRMAGMGSIPMIQYVYDKGKGYHVGCGVRVPDQLEKDKKRVDGIQLICDQVFSGQKSFKHCDAIAEIMKYSHKKERTSIEIFKEMKAHLMVKQGEDKRWRIA